MAVQDMQFGEGIFFAHLSDRVSADDARTWARQLSHYAKRADAPLVALVDARDVRYIAQEARRIFVRAGTMQYFRAMIMVTDDVVTAQTARMLNILSPHAQHTFVFDTFDEGLNYAHELTNEASV